MDPSRTSGDDPRIDASMATEVQRERYAGMDALRGVAVLGILLVNIVGFSMPHGVLTQPHSFGDMSGWNEWIWRLTHVFAEGKFIAIFSMLFGAGAWLLLARAPDVGRAWRDHSRRMAVLLAIGMAHAYLVWYGDVLVGYALVGFLLFALRDLPAKAMLGLGALLYGAGVAVLAGLGVLMLWVAHSDEGAAVIYGADQFAREVAAYQGTWLDAAVIRATTAFLAQTMGIFLYYPTLTLGLMLVGMALARVGFFQGRWERRRYLTFAVIALPIGLAGPTLGLWLDETSGHDPVRFAAIYYQLNIATAPATALAYCALVLAACARDVPPVLGPLVPVGHMALTCYLLTSVIATTIFYGFGFGWFGEVDRVQQFGIVVAIWVVLIVFANAWSRYLGQGPMEWVWRRMGRRHWRRKTP